MKKQILFVCLGNICRSPAAESVFACLIQKQGLVNKYHIDSAGTGAWHVGSQADSRMKDAAKKRGIVIESIARQITLDDLHKFDLILTMDNENLSTVIALAKELDSTLTSKIKPILSYSSNAQLMDVPDPYYGGEKGFEKVLDLLEDACEGLLKDLSVKN